MKELLKGKKSYIVAAGVVLTALGSFLTGDATVVEAVTTALGGLGIGSLRAGVAKAAKGEA